MKISIHRMVSLLMVLCLAAGVAAAEQNVPLDGVYVPDSFSWSGGSGRVSISCEKVTVSGGEATATIVFSSPSYGYVKVGDEKYYGDHDAERSTFEIPVILNQNNPIIGMTTKMSASHEIAYTIYVGLGDAGADTSDAPVSGLRWVSDDTIDSAELFSIHRYEGGFVAIDVAGEGRYLFIPQDAEVPAGLEKNIVLIRTPVQRAYVASDGALALLNMLPSDDAMASISAVGGGTEHSERISQRIESGGISFCGDADAPDYAALLKAGCDFAILPGANELTAERLDLLGIPAFTDRSGDEATDQGRLEWIKVYGAIFGCEALANDVYEQMKRG